MKLGTTLIVAVLLLLSFRPAVAQSEPDDILYGEITSGSHTIFARYEFRWQQGGDLQIAFAPYGHLPAPLQDVQLSTDHEYLAFVWPDGATCELQKLPTEGWSYEGFVHLHWAGRCVTPAGEERQITVGTETAPDIGEDPPASETDLRIIERAVELLSTVGGWNRRDERACEDDDQRRSWSLFCALYRASVEVNGEYIHARRAMDLVRLAVRQATGRGYVHTLRDYNNDAETSLEQVLACLREARAKVRREVSSPFRQE